MWRTSPEIMSNMRACLPVLSRGRLAVPRARLSYEQMKRVARCEMNVQAHGHRYRPDNACVQGERPYTVRAFSYHRGKILSPPLGTRHSVTIPVTPAGTRIARLVFGGSYEPQDPRQRWPADWAMPLESNRSPADRHHGSRSTREPVDLRPHPGCAARRHGGGVRQLRVLGPGRTRSGALTLHVWTGVH